jgi:hypothetical protein
MKGNKKNKKRSTRTQEKKQSDNMTEKGKKESRVTKQHRIVESQEQINGLVNPLEHKSFGSIKDM